MLCADDCKEKPEDAALMLPGIETPILVFIRNLRSLFVCVVRSTFPEPCWPFQS